MTAVYTLDEERMGKKHTTGPFRSEMGADVDGFLVLVSVVVMVAGLLDREKAIGGEGKTVNAQEKRQLNEGKREQERYGELLGRSYLASLVL